MSFRITNLDNTILPAALLPLFKQHARVDFADDDALITDILGSAIDLYERKTGQMVTAGTAEWKPDSFDQVTEDGVLVPIQPITDMTIADADAVDVTADYQIVGNRYPGRASGLYLQRASSDVGVSVGLTATMTIGFADAASMPPATKSAIFRLAAHLYENRESVTDLLLRDADWWADDLLVGAWVPRA